MNLNVTNVLQPGSPLLFYGYRVNDMYTNLGREI